VPESEGSPEVDEGARGRLNVRAASSTLPGAIRVSRPHALAALLAVAAGTLLAGPAEPAAAAGCERGFTCGTLDVPLDHANPAAGVVHLRFAAQRSFPRGAGTLIALAGGPGQSSVPLASSFADSLAPALRRYRLVVLDQRGTGASGAFVCPTVQRLRPLDAYRPDAVAACAAAIGPRRAFYSTADSVLDLDALRARLGAEKIALMGVSYGTHVALQYARAFPARVDRLILDSIVGPGDPDGFMLDTYRAFPRVLREQCGHGLCSRTTLDPVSDLALLLRRLQAGPLTGTAFDSTGHRRAVSYTSGEQISFLLTAGDLNPLMQPFLPAAISSAVRGDTAMLMRLRAVAQGPPTPVGALSSGLNVTTGCEDAELPYSLTTPLADRPALVAAALAAIPPSSYAPFDAATVQSSSYVDDCLQWPQDVVRPSFDGPLPDVPALLLSGRLDTRTPLENALATAAQFAHPTLVAVRGTGHDVLDSDLTGCSSTALERFIAGRPVGTPCKGKSSQIQPLPLPPQSIGDFRSAPGVGGRRGRALFAALDTTEEARIVAIQYVFSGLELHGGGLRAGSFSLRSPAAKTMRLRDYAFVPGLRISGRLRITTDSPEGHIRVRGPKGLSGELDLDGNGGARGRLGGKRVSYRPAKGSATAASGSRSLRVDGPSTPRLPHRFVRWHRPLG
jgi:pimeloyl-ACP methyl ester carboxylesterase